MSKCIGCGIKLQNTEKYKDGYVEDLSHELCERCFTINHKGKTETKCQKIIVKEKVESKYQIKLNGEDTVYLLKGNEL